MILPIQNDPMGSAINDFFEGRLTKKLLVKSSMFEDDEMPIRHLFRTEAEMSKVEQIALTQCKGNVLDIGAGAGCHSLALQRKENINVTALDNSPLSVSTMQRRGIKSTILNDFFEHQFTEKYDTLLLMMNGIGIVGTTNKLKDFFEKVDTILAMNGCIILDSSDIKYIYENDEGEFEINENHYYGEVDFTIHYGDIHGLPFNWLYIDKALLQKESKKYGFYTEIIYEGEHFDYLAKITRMGI